MFTPDRIAVENVDGTVVAQRLAPADSFAGHQMHTRWDELHRAYSNGEALWTYLTTPFLLAGDGVTSRRPSLGGRAMRRGACCAPDSLARSRPAAAFRTFSSTTAVCCAVTITR
jgi:hypothetical protein